MVRTLSLVIPIFVLNVIPEGWLGDRIVGLSMAICTLTMQI